MLSVKAHTLLLEQQGVVENTGIQLNMGVVSVKIASLYNGEW